MLQVLEKHMLSFRQYLFQQNKEKAYSATQHHCNVLEHLRNLPKVLTGCQLKTFDILSNKKYGQEALNQKAESYIEQEQENIGF